MPSSTAPGILIARLALVVYGARLGTLSMDYALGEVGRAGSAGPLMNLLYARDLGSLSLAAAAARVVDNTGVPALVRADAIAYVEARLAHVPAGERGSVLVEIVDLLAGLEGDPNWGSLATAFNTEVARLMLVAGTQDVYVRPAAAEGRYAPWITPTTGGGGDTGGGGNPGSSGTLLDVKALSDGVAAAVGADPLADEGIEIVLTRAVASTRSYVDANGDGVVSAGEIKTHSAVLGADSIKAGAANERVTLDQYQLRANAQIDLGAQQDDTAAGKLREGADVVTIVHGDLDRDGLVNADDAPLRPTLALAVQAASAATIRAEGGALHGQKAAYNMVGVERLDIAQATGSDRYDDSLDLSACNAGTTLNLGPAVTVGSTFGGGTAGATVGQLDANALDSGAVAPVGPGLGSELIVIAGATAIERFTGSAAGDRIIVAADSAMQSVGNGGFAVAASNVRTRFDQSTAEVGGFTSSTSMWEDQSLYRFDLGGGDGDALDYAAENTDITVSVATNIGAPQRVFVGAPGAGGGRIDLASGIERYFGGSGSNWIDLGSATLDVTVEFSRLSGLRELREPNGDDGVNTTGLTSGAEVRATGSGAVFASFIERHAGVMPSSSWANLQGSAKAETVILTDAESAVPNLLRLAGGANKVDCSALTTPITFQLGAVQVGTAALLQSSSIASDTIEQFVGADPRNDRLSVVGPRFSSGVLSISALANGAVVSATDRPNTSEVDPRLHVVDLGAGTVTESLFGQYAPVGSSGVVAERAFVTHVSGFADVSNAGDADAVHLIGDASANVLSGGVAADLIIGGRGGDSMIGGPGPDVFAYRTEVDSPGGSIAAGQQSGNDFGNSEATLLASRDTVVSFQTGADILAFVVNDGYDSVRANGPLPASLAASLNAAVPVSTAFAADSVAVDIGRDAASSGTVTDFDNYFVMTNGSAPLGITDLMLRVAATSGGDLIDASAGRAATPLNSPSNDGLRVDIVYTVASQSRAAEFDQIVHFRSGSDKIDLSFLKLPRAEITFAGTGVDFDTNHDNVVDALDTGLVRTLGAAPALAINAAAANLFIDGSTWRPVVAQPVAVTGGTTTTLFVDADGDGSYSPVTDMVVVLFGVVGVASGDFIVDQYGGGWPS